MMTLTVLVAAAVDVMHPHRIVAEASTPAQLLEVGAHRQPLERTVDHLVQTMTARRGRRRRGLQSRPHRKKRPTSAFPVRCPKI